MENSSPSTGALSTNGQSSSSATSQAHKHTVSCLVEPSEFEVASKTQPPTESTPEPGSNLVSIFGFAGLLRKNPELLSIALMPDLIRMARLFVSVIDCYEDFLWGNVQLLKYYRSCIPSLEERLRLMRRLGNAKVQEEELKAMEKKVRKTAVKLEKDRQDDEDYVLLHAAVRDMVGEIQKRLGGDMEETERKQAEEALTEWKTELKARKEVRERERPTLEREIDAGENVPDIENIAEFVVETWRQSLVERFWLRIDSAD